MAKKKIYLIMAVLGTVLPYTQLILFLLENGLDIVLLLDQIINNTISLFAWLDVIISALVLFIFIFYELKNGEIKYWFLAILGTLLVGVSCGFPLFLYLRESARGGQ